VRTQPPVAAPMAMPVLKLIELSELARLSEPGWLWAVLVGWWMWLCYAAAGLLNMCTIVGVPFGIQSFKMGKLAFCPFGAVVA
jgi:uncharacterized membrane protein YccF (DUF307 family)